MTTDKALGRGEVSLMAIRVTQETAFQAGASLPLPFLQCGCPVSAELAQFLQSRLLLPPVRPVQRGHLLLTWWEVHRCDEGIEGTEDTPTLFGRGIWKG